MMRPIVVFFGFSHVLQASGLCWGLGISNPPQTSGPLAQLISCAIVPLKMQRNLPLSVIVHGPSRKIGSVVWRGGPQRT